MSKLTWKDLMKEVVSNDGDPDNLEGFLNDPVRMQNASEALAKTMQEAIDTRVDWGNPQDTQKRLEGIEEKVPELKMERIIQDRGAVHIPVNRTLH